MVNAGIMLAQRRRGRPSITPVLCQRFVSAHVVLLYI